MIEKKGGLKFPLGTMISINKKGDTNGRLFFVLSRKGFLFLRLIYVVLAVHIGHQL